MIKITIGILICTLLLSTKVIEAAESAPRLNDISKAVSAQLLRMKKKKMVTKPDTTQETKTSSKLPSKDKNTVNNLQKKDSEALAKNTQPQGALEKPSKASPSINSHATVEEKDKTLQQDEKKTGKLEAKKIPPTNLQKNDLLRQQIQNIVNTN
jgi:hypothetical protein